MKKIADCFLELELSSNVVAFVLAVGPCAEETEGSKDYVEGDGKCGATAGKLGV